MTDYCVFRAYELNVFSVHVQLYTVYNCTHCKTVLSVRLYSVYNCTHCKMCYSQAAWLLLLVNQSICQTTKRADQ